MHRGGKRCSMLYQTTGVVSEPTRPPLWTAERLEDLDRRMTARIYGAVTTPRRRSYDAAAA